MAECPKCNSRLRMRDWKQHCPHCGANIVIYDLQERLMKEADTAEVQYYHFQKKIDCIKASFSGSKLSMVRIVTSILPVVALLLPVVSLTLGVPFTPYSGNMGIIQVADIVGTFDMGALFGMLASSDTRMNALLFILGTVFLLLSVVTLLVHLISVIFTYFPKGKKLLYTLDGIFLVLPVLSAVMFFAMPGNEAISASPSYGYILYILLIILSGVMDFLVFRENIEVKHAPCFVGGIPIEEYLAMVEKGVPQEDIRNEMYKRLTEQQKQKEAALEKELKEKEAAVNG